VVAVSLQKIQHFEFLLLKKNDIEAGEIIDGVRRKLSTHSSVIKILENPGYFGGIVVNGIPFQLNDSAVIFCSSMCDSKIPIQLNGLKANEIKVITYIKDLNDLLIDDNHLRSHLHRAEYVIWEANKKIELLTREYYANSQCVNSFNTTESYFKINIFNFEEMKWSKKLKFFKKNENFHECFYFISGVFSLDEHGLVSNQEQLVHDLFLDLTNTLASARNFTPVLMTADGTILKYPEIYVRNYLQEILEDFKFIYLFFDKTIPWHALDAVFTMSHSIPIENDEIFLIVTPGESFSDYEKLLLPFDTLTWTYILITFGCAFLMISGIHLMPKKIQDLVYGKFVKTPAYNVIGKFPRIRISKF
jgi:hypothetical protein